MTVALAEGLGEPGVPPIQRFHPVKTHLWLSVGALVAGLAVAALTASRAVPLLRLARGRGRLP